jgi:hypothetical protein
MIIQMRLNMSGGRYDNRQWPPAEVDFEVPDEEGRALIKDRNAVFVRQSADPVLPPAADPVISEPASTATGPVWSTPEEVAHEPGPGTEPGIVITEHAPEEVVHAPAPEPEMPEQPRPADLKRTWEDYAVAQGMDPDDAVDATKAELMSKYGGRLL